MTHHLPNQISYSANYTAASALKTTFKTTTLKVLCFSSLILNTSALGAADADQESGADTSSSEQRTQENSTETQANSTGSQKRQAGDKGGVFLPSEDISEDVAITFPVDI